MSLPRAKVLRVDDAVTARPLLERSVSPDAARMLAREEVLAHLAAERIARAAQVEAESILTEARGRAGSVAEEARVQARAEEVAAWLSLRRTEQARIDADGDRVVTLATLLAERLIGASLELHPARVVALATEVLAEARGARKAVLEAHPLDAEALRGQLALGGLAPGSVEVRDEPSLARGALRLKTDLGTIEAQLGPRLERLAGALRDALT